ncbi:N-acetylgalactosamine 6-sulfate sulfatase, partial [Verrucomicrobia bacterium]|nr:N-acetylgalactosamine 6-sulfate sulfatase [Verrucomicrobiota bacterium]
TLEDRIYWNMETVATGDYRVEAYYTCPKKDLGSTIQLSFGGSKILAKITKANDPPLLGAEKDHFLRKGESYVKDFKPMDLGVIHLKKGKHALELKALEIPGGQVMEVRLLMFHRVK